MWVYTQNGFYSVVEYDAMMDWRKGMQRKLPGRSNKVLIRTRFREDIDYLVSKIATESEVNATPTADYAFRVIALKKEWSKFLAFEGLGIDYTNFKSRVDKTLGAKRHDQLMSVWSVMRRPLSTFGWAPRGKHATKKPNGKSPAQQKFESLEA